ncbi:hypothetical protein [Halomonas sp. NO4]|nr:hypothetical protein [Halomonas sp. NO4]
MTETEAIHLARSMFYQGHSGIGLEPMNQSSLRGMIAQVERDLETAESLS